jgi:hypothetical protein
MGEEFIQPVDPPRRVVANACYTVGTCLAALLGLYVWLGADRLAHERLTPLPVAVKSKAPSIDDQLRPHKSSAPPAVTVAPKPGAHSAYYRHVSTTSRAAAHKNAVKPRAVRGGITIVGRHGTTTTVAPATVGDRNARPEYSTPVFARVSGDLVDDPAPTGPRLYLPTTPASCGQGSPSGGLNFYNFDNNVPQVTRMVNSGANESTWCKSMLVLSPER